VFPLELIHKKIVAADLRHLLIGGQALNTYGSPRTTLDVDFLIPEMDRDSWQKILSEEGFTLKNDGGNFRQYAPPYQVDWPLDLMIVNKSTFEKLHSASKPVECLGITTRVPSPEHLIALKVHAIRNGSAARMEKDFPDIVRLARMTKLDPDSAAIREIFDRYGNKELYERFLRATKEPN